MFRTYVQDAPRNGRGGGCMLPTGSKALPGLQRVFCLLYRINSKLLQEMADDFNLA